MNNFIFKTGKVKASATGVFCCLIFLFPYVISAYLYAATMATVQVFKKAGIDKDKILLGEIAKIDGQDHRLVQKLNSIVLGKAPLPGKSRRIDGRHIKVRLKQSGIDLTRITLKSPAQIEVSRNFIDIPKDKIEKVVLDYIYRKIPWERDKVKVGNIKINSGVRLPKGNVAYKVLPPDNTDFLGTVPMSVVFQVDGKFCRKVWAFVNIEVLTEVVVAKRPIGRYHIISEDDLCLQKMDLAKLSSNIITDIEDVLGKRVKRAIKAKTVLRTDLVELSPLVKRGDIVLIIAETEGLRITALGEVKEKGRKGERIRVANLDSKEKIYARVVNSNTVKVDF